MLIRTTSRLTLTLPYLFGRICCLIIVTRRLTWQSRLTY
nr:MAG TPA: hypothetical protein [Caudoviricetes sp.]